MTNKQTLELALDALKVEYRMYEATDPETGAPYNIIQAIKALEEALAKQEQGEPVAWRTFDGEGLYFYCSYEDNETYADVWNKRNPNHKGWVEPLYTTPQQRTWVGLTDEEIFETHKQVDSMQYLTFGKAIEAKLKEKNT